MAAAPPAPRADQPWLPELDEPESVEPPTVAHARLDRRLRSYTVTGPASKDQYGPFDPAPGLTADAYHAEGTASTTYYESQTLTQKGKGTIVYGQLNQSDGTPQVSNEQCYAITNVSGGFTLDPISADPCNTLGLIPA